MKFNWKPVLPLLPLLVVLGSFCTHLSIGAEPDETVNDARTSGTVKTFELTSPHQRGQTLVQVLTPETMTSGKRYPVLFVLPVEEQTGKRWGSSLAEAMKIDIANRYDIICVFPTFSALPWYADHPTSPDLQQETYFLQDVIPFVEERFPVSNKSESRYLIGFSKSGWGAWSLLLRHPDKFHKALAWDAPLMLDHPGPYGTEPIFGTQENFERYQLTRLLKANRELFGEKVRLYHWGYHGFRKHHADMHKLLEKLRIKSIYRDGPDREHHWESGWLADAVELLLEQD